MRESAVGTEDAVRPDAVPPARTAPDPLDEDALVGATPLGHPPALQPPGPDPVARLGPPPPTDRLRGWLVAVGLALVAGVLRFVGLGVPTDAGTPVFDEKHYVPQAWQMLRNGGVEDNPAYGLVVHPPLGKQLIALGELAFGYDGFGWRAAAALAGTLCVLLVVRVGRRLTRSTLLGGVAGVLLTCDAVSQVQSRMGMLDIFLTLFVLAAFAALVHDRDDVRERLRAVVAEGRAGGDVPTPAAPPPPAPAQFALGPRLGVRWWRLATGVLLGGACAVKWSGIYWLVAFAALGLVWDLTARRAAGVARPRRGTLRWDLPPAAWAYVLVPTGVYLAAWWAWFRSEDGVDRHVVGTGPGSHVGPDGPWSFVPSALRALWYNAGHVLEFHTTLVTDPAKPHPWESKPWGWPLSLRPSLYYYQQGDAVLGCGAEKCVRTTIAIGSPALWWVSLLVLAWALWRIASRRDWRYAAVVVGYAAGYLPWFVNLDRQMYFFYVTPLAPFLVLGVALVLGEILGPRAAGKERRATGAIVVGLYVGLVVANFVWLWPILVGDPISQAHWEAEMWLPSWR